mmetsp:Transcript_24714/g.32914  ORF Transcript_24714/g.32914 Transcript_24714/m.32914 type:complete len:101 (+) Transcript_24714:371-673(+)
MKNIKLSKKTKAAGSSAVEKTKEFNEKHQVVEKTKAASSSAAVKAKEVNETHKVVDKTKNAAASAWNGIQGGVGFLQKKIQKKGDTTGGKTTDVGHDEFS